MCYLSVRFVHTVAWIAVFNLWIAGVQNLEELPLAQNRIVQSCLPGVLKGFPPCCISVVRWKNYWAPGKICIWALYLAKNYLSNRWKHYKLVSKGSMSSENLMPDSISISGSKLLPIQKCHHIQMSRSILPLLYLKKRVYNIRNIWVIWVIKKNLTAAIYS